MADEPLEPNPSQPPGSKNWKTQLRSIGAKLSPLGARIRPFGEKIRRSISEKLNKESIKKSIQDFDPQATLSWLTSTLQKRSAGFYGTLATVTLSTYFISDLTSLILAEYIPEPTVSRVSRHGSGSNRQKTINDYSPIFTRNLFNSQGLIPGEDAPGGSSPTDMGGPPVKTTLPLALVGTLVMTNELRSIATIEDKSVSIVYPVRIDDEIPNKIRITKIEPRRATFINISTGRREYVELPEDASAVPKLTFGTPAGGPGIEKVSPTQFSVSRVEVDRALADFNNILTQARAVPNFENGVASGYKLFQIVPGSIYDKLGLQNGDVISGLNGQPINDPGKAFEMLSELKTANHLELQVRKDGRQSTYTYDIH